MKKVILFVLIGINVPVNAQQLPSEAKDVIKAIYTEALGTQQGYKWLHHICTKIGPRSSGSDAANQAAIYTKQMMLNAGADTAWLQPVEVPKWYRGEEWSKAYTRGDTLSLPTTALGGSVPTPKEGIKAAVVEVGSFEELEKLGKEGIEGKIVFYNTYMDHSLISTFNAYGGAVKYRWAGAMEAVKYGALATVMRSVTLLRDDLPHTGAMSYGDSEVKIPTAAISWLAADKLAKMLNNGLVELELFLDCGVRGKSTNYNMIADFKGAEKPNEIMLVGGHIDSWDLGQGAQDDGAGCAQAMQVPNLIKKVGYKNNRTIRVVLWANEEFGLDGAKEYARWAKSQGVRHWVAMESDAGGDVPRGFGISADDIRLEQVRTYEELFSPYGLHVFAKGGGGADLGPLRGYDDFFIGYRPESQRYFDFHHSARDNINAIHPRSLEMGSASMSALFYLLDHLD
ncbi:MAG: M28 family peptidase [Bacteroidota bacterium]|nr:M28 family peptidase [Bacteroidota bacterium]